jgi:hypothetical protein
VGKKSNYFRHVLNAHNDLKIMNAKELGGLKLVGAYWIILEVYGKALIDDDDQKTTQTISGRRIANALGLRLDSCQTVTGLLSDCNLIDAVWDKSHISSVQLSIPNFLKYFGRYEKTEPMKCPNKRKEKENKIKKRKENTNLEIHPHNFDILDQTKVIQKWNEIFPNKTFKGFYLGGGKHENNYLKSASIIKTLDEWVEIFNRVKISNFLQTNSWSTLTWVINYDNAMEIMQGKYDNEKTNTDYELDDME